ncbi:MAG: hypothetical protein HY099_05195 [Nitrospirae bacterium]|nr:hypothetical protein [Nitrospirota bacterium]
MPEKNAPFFAYWVSRFFDFARNRDIPSTEYHEAAVLEFLDALRSDKRILEWQPRQADDAIRLYYLHFLGKAGTKVSDGITITNISEAINEMRRLIRLRHYSYSTERTYLQWVEKFLSYALESRKNIRIRHLIQYCFSSAISSAKTLLTLAILSGQSGGRNFRSCCP